MSESSLSAHCPNPSAKAFCRNQSLTRKSTWLRLAQPWVQVIITNTTSPSTSPISQTTTIGSDYGTRLTYLRRSNLTVSQSVPNITFRQQLHNYQKYPIVETTKGLDPSNVFGQNKSTTTTTITTTWNKTRGHQDTHIPGWFTKPNPCRETHLGLG